MKSRDHGSSLGNSGSGLESGEILVNSLRCRAMFQIMGSAADVALRHVLLVRHVRVVSWRVSFVYVA